MGTTCIYPMASFVRGIGSRSSCLACIYNHRHHFCTSFNANLVVLKCECILSTGNAISSICIHTCTWHVHVLIESYSDAVNFAIFRYSFPSVAYPWSSSEVLHYILCSGNH